jgi:hypothetical protein
VIIFKVAAGITPNFTIKKCVCNQISLETSEVNLQLNMIILYLKHICIVIFYAAHEGKFKSYCSTCIDYLIILLHQMRHEDHYELSGGMEIEKNGKDLSINTVLDKQT